MLKNIDKVLICRLYDERLGKLPKVSNKMENVEKNEETSAVIAGFESGILKDLKTYYNLGDSDSISFINNPEFSTSTIISNDSISLTGTIMAIEEQTSYALIPTTEFHYEHHPNERVFKLIQVKKISLGSGKLLITERAILPTETELGEYGYYDIVESYKLINDKTVDQELVNAARKKLWDKLMKFMPVFIGFENEVFETEQAYIENFYKTHVTELFGECEKKKFAWISSIELYDNRAINENNETIKITDEYKLSLKK